LESRIIGNPHAKEITKRGILAAGLLAKNKVDVLLTSAEMHKGGGYYALEDNFIEMQQTNAKTFGELLGQFK